MSVVHGIGGRAFTLALDRRALTGPADHHRQLITGYDQARRFLVDPGHSRACLVQVPPGPASAMSVTEMDPPRHTRVRTLLNGAFSARATQRRLPVLERRARALVSRLRAAGPGRDIMAEFCIPFAYGVHCDMLGMPDSARQSLYRWSCARSAHAGMHGSALHQTELGLHGAVCEMLEHPHRSCERGLLQNLTEIHRSGDLSKQELTGLTASLFFDGHILAANQLANTLLCLLTHSNQLATMVTQSALLDATVEETLRYSPAITVGMTRLTTGRARVAVAFGAANRDPHMFAAPDRFDPTRTGPAHLSFGGGPTIAWALSSCGPSYARR